MARNWKVTLAFCIADSLFSDIHWICKIWLIAQNISSHLSCITQNVIKAFHSNKLTTPFTSQFAFFWFFWNWNQQIKVSIAFTENSNCNF
jgi:hypothetical protein